MKKALRLCVLCLAVMVVLSLFANVLATSTTPYSSYNAKISANKLNASCAIYACYCNPVNNYLSARLEYQYKDPVTQQFKPGSTPTNALTNVPDRDYYVYMPDGNFINYAHGIFQARCKNGSNQYLDAYAYAYLTFPKTSRRVNQGVKVINNHCNVCG